MSQSLRVAIDARLSSGRYGGVEQFIIGLAAGLQEVAHPGDEFVFMANGGDVSWLEPYVGGACTTALMPAGPLTRVRNLLKRTPGILRIAQAWRSRRSNVKALPVPDSPGFAESLGADVIYFPVPSAYRTNLPSIYHVWDLQSIHFPQFFTQELVLTRDLWYRTFCAQASIVSVPTEWGKQDLLSHFDLDPAKIEVIPGASVLAAYPVPEASEMERARRRYYLPERFVFYPAYTWPHKNHLALIRAIALLNERGVMVHLVFSGPETHYAALLKAEIRKLALDDRVRFLGFVSPVELQCLYRLATCMIFPSYFEGWGLPISEAFQSGLPVASSNRTCLPEVTSGAALLFDPDDVDAIADSIRRLFHDDALREDLSRRGREVAGRQSWADTARRFRTLYARLASER